MAKGTMNSSITIQSLDWTGGLRSINIYTARSYTRVKRGKAAMSPQYTQYRVFTCSLVGGDREHSGRGGGGSGQSGRGTRWRRQSAKNSIHNCKGARDWAETRPSWCSISCPVLWPKLVFRSDPQAAEVGLLNAADGNE